MNKAEILKKARACDAMIQAFTLLLTPSDRDQQEAADIIFDLRPEDARVLRSAVARLDGMLDQAAMQRHLNRQARTERRQRQ